MTEPSNNFPLLFTLERVLNGYVLTSKYNTGSLVEDGKAYKEVVTDDKINNRIGQLLKLDSMAKESPVYFRVEALSMRSGGKSAQGRSDKDIDAKSAYAHLSEDGRKQKDLLCLRIEETNTVEVYGHEAEEVARKTGFSLFKSGDTPYVCIPDTPDCRKTLAAQVRVCLKSVKLSYIREWYESRKMQIDTQATASTEKREAQPSQKKETAK